MIETYNECLHKLFNLRSLKYSLSNISKVAIAIGSPQNVYNSVHVGGTCGKGSVSTKIYECLRHMGHCVGLYTSPHISSFRERIEINGKLIEKHEVISLLNQITELSNRLEVNLSFFETTTLMAFKYFADKNVQWAVVEVGLGGYLDATNILQNPACTVITSIGWDHMNILGKTLNDIAYEKSGIMKRLSPVVLGPSATMYNIFHNKATELNCELLQVKSDPRGETFDEENSRIASDVVNKVLKLEFSSTALRRCISVKPPYRMQILTKGQVDRFNETLKNSSPCADLPEIKGPISVILDAAHNETAIDRLCREVGYRFYGKPVRFICSLSAQRHVTVLEPIISQFGPLSYGRLKALNFVEMNHTRRKSVMQLQDELTDEKISKDFIDAIKKGLLEVTVWLKETENDKANMFREAVIAGYKASSDEGSLLVICGTMFMLRDILEIFDLPREPEDEIDINERSIDLQKITVT